MAAGETRGGEDGGSADGSPPRRASFWDAFRNPRLALMLGLGFASGLPNPATGSTLTAWLSMSQVDVVTIGLFSYVHLPYSLKFLWAPVLDRFSLPGLARRRGWMLATQVLILLGIALMATLDPRTGPWTLALVALVISFVSATQDVAVDAYRTEILPANQRASGAALFVAAYRGALIVAGAGALMFSEALTWRGVYLGLAALMGVGIVTTLLAPTPVDEPRAPRTLKAAVVEPLSEILQRPGVWRLLLVVLLYKLGDVVAGALQMPFLLGTLGFTPLQVGAVLKGLGLGATIVGALVGGGFVARLGLKRALIVFGVAQGVANGLYAWLAFEGRDLVLMTVTITADNFLNGMGTAAFVALLMSLCDTRFTAFQYALLSALMSVPGRLVGGVSGFLAEALGWPSFFVLTILFALPALVLLDTVPRRTLERA